MRLGVSPKITRRKPATASVIALALIVTITEARFCVRDISRWGDIPYAER